MNKLTTKPTTSLEQVLIRGNLAGLSENQRLEYVSKVCKLMGISPLGKPFDYIQLQGRLVLYANRSATEQLRALHKVSINITSRERVDGLYVVTVKAKMKGGKEDEAIGAVNIKGLSGEALANAMMKAETKAKRRVTLSICGLGMLDESEIMDVTEREIKAVAKAHVQETETKIQETNERPEFEKTGDQPYAEPPAETTEHVSDTDYICKVKPLKGKRLSQLSRARLQTWIEGYDKARAEGHQFSVDVQDDAFHIRAFLREP